MRLPPGSPYLAVVGSDPAGAEELRLAYEVGHAVASQGAVLVCGGLGGVMEAACRGADEAQGLTVGILPGDDRREANPFLHAAVATGMGEARNALVVGAADAVVAVGGELGTLSEVALASKAGKPVVSTSRWELARDGRRLTAIAHEPFPEQAVEMALRLAVERVAGD